MTPTTTTLTTTICPTCGRSTPTPAGYCTRCGSAMTVDAGERRTVTVMFANLVGFNEHARTSSSEELQRVADAAARLVATTVERYGGTIDKVIAEGGFKVMALFGAPTTHEDDPLRAVRAALDLRDEAAAAQELAGLRLAIGINTGDTIYAPIGPAGEYTVLGDTVNTAARLMGAAASDEILIGEATQRGVSATVETESVPPLVVKNKAEPVPAWRARGPLGTPASRPERRAPVIGRDTELAELRDLWAATRDHGRAHLAVVIGGAGIGKSRIIGTVCREAREVGRVLTGHCLSYGEGNTYWPIVEILRELAGILHSDSEAEVSAKLGDLLESLGSTDMDELRTMAVAIANLVAAPVTPRGTYSAAKVSRNELHWGIRRVLQLAAAAHPMILRIEDLHWAEPTLLDLLAYIAEPDASAPLLLLASARPEFDDEPIILQPASNRRVIELGPLSEEHSARLLNALLGDADRSRLEPLLQAAAGNPLFLEEIVQMLTETGVLDNAWNAADGVGSIPVPDGIHTLINARLDRLPEDERRLAGQAAVVGGIFWRGTLAMMAPDEDIDRTLAALVERDVIVARPESTIEGEEEFTFRHVLLREVAYQRIPKIDRARLHAEAGAWIATLPGPEDEHIEFIAFHLEQACRLTGDVEGMRGPVLAAVDALRRAGLKAEGRDGTREASRYYERALDIADERYPETKIELTFHRANTQGLLGLFDESLEQMRVIAEQARDVGRHDLICRAQIWLAAVLGQMRGDLPSARRHIDTGRSLAKRIHDRRLAIQTEMFSGALRATFEGDPTGGLDELRASCDAAADLDGDQELHAEALAQLGSAYANAGRLSDAEQCFAACRAIASELGSIRWEAIATRFLGSMKYYLGPSEEAEELSLKALRWHERQADAPSHVQTLRRLSALAIVRDDLDAAAEYLRQARPLIAAVGGVLATEIERATAEVCARRGDLAGATSAAERASEGDRETAPAVSVAAARIAAGFAAAAAGDADQVRSTFAFAVEALERAGQVLDAAEASVAAAWALSKIGDTDAARDRLDHAERIFTGVGAAAMAERVTRLQST